MSPQARLLARLSSGDTYSARTCCQSQSSSSATSCARPVRVPWPISERAMRTTVVSSGLITTQMPTSVTAAGCASGSGRPECASRARGRRRQRRPSRGSERRRECQSVAHGAAPYALPPSDGGGVDCLADALIGAAATDVGHRRVDVRIGGLRVGLQQRGGGHDLAGLAVAALRHVVLQPGDLHRMAEPVGRQALDRGDLRIADRADRHLSRIGSRRRPDARCRRRIARCRSRISCRSCRAIAQHPEQWRVGVGIDAA